METTRISKEYVEIVSGKRDDGRIEIKMLWYPKDKICMFTKSRMSDIPLDGSLGGFSHRQIDQFAALDPTAPQAMKMWNILMPTRTYALGEWRQLLKEKLGSSTEVKMLRR